MDINARCLTQRPACHEAAQAVPRRAMQIEALG
jgi:hypothetical protein